MNRTWVEIKRSALFHNIDQLSSLISPSQFAAVIKANAYGHGLTEIGTLVNQHDKVTVLCVAHIAEALQLQAAGINKPLVVIAPFIDDNSDEAILKNIQFVVYNLATINFLHERAKKLQKKVSVHIKIDTGMTRLGFQAAEIPSLINQCSEYSSINIIGIMTHISTKDNEDTNFTESQLNQFNQLITTLKRPQLLTHALSSGALEYAQKSNYSFARIGTNLYGYWSSLASKQRALAEKPDLSLIPILSWKTRIMQIKIIEPGTFVGYAGTFQAKTRTTIAILPIGYWDGYPRALSNKGHVIVNHQRAPVLGIVSMNLMVIDITGIAAQVDDEVILMNHEITADHHAALCNAINIEFTTRINPLIPRIIVD